jgi:hypothetical protein
MSIVMGISSAAFHKSKPPVLPRLFLLLPARAPVVAGLLDPGSLVDPIGERGPQIRGT